MGMLLWLTLSLSPHSGVHDPWSMLSLSPHSGVCTTLVNTRVLTCWAHYLGKCYLESSQLSQDL